MWSGICTLGKASVVASEVCHVHKDVTKGSRRGLPGMGREHIRGPGWGTACLSRVRLEAEVTGYRVSRLGGSELTGL
jgi:hypothetical protein